MCGGGGDGGAGAIAKQNAENQSLINQGMQQLNSIFWGGTYGTGTASSYDPTKTYYTAAGSPFAFKTSDSDFLSWVKGSPYSGNYQKYVLGSPPVDRFSAGYGGRFDNRGEQNYQRILADWNTQKDKTLKQAQQGYGDYLAKKGSLYTGTATSKGFGPDFYQNAQNAYINYALPQLASQYDATQRQLQYKLAGQGLLGSSAQQELQNKLGQDLATQRINIANTGLDQANQLRQQVTGQYNTLVGQLEASANPGVTAQQALQSASQLSSPSAMPAVGQLFNTYANTYLAGLNNSMYGNQAYNPYLNYNLRNNLPQAPVVTSGN